VFLYFLFQVVVQADFFVLTLSSKKNLKIGKSENFEVQEVCKQNWIHSFCPPQEVQKNSFLIG
jgi:hypothetical protein